MKMALSLSNVRVRLGSGAAAHEAVAGVTASFPPGSWTAIVGPNGAGKSTLLRAAAGLLPFSGRACLDDMDAASIAAQERAKRLSWFSSSEGASADMCARDVVMLGRLPHHGWLAAPSRADDEATQAALQAVGAQHLGDRPMGALSSGERQRVLLARAVAVHAPVWLMDEPLAHLDPPHQADWLGLVRQHVAGGGCVVSVLHEVAMALRADQLLVLQDGRVAAHGASDDPSLHRALESVFEHRIRVVPIEGQWTVLMR